MCSKDKSLLPHQKSLLQSEALHRRPQLVGPSLHTLPWEGGHKRKLRLIDFKRNYDGVPAVVKSIEYDPNRSARIALLYYTDGSKAYIIAPNGLQVGQTVMSGEDVAPEVGNTLPLAKIPVGTPDPLYRAPSRTGRLHGSLRRYVRSAHFA